MRIPSSEEYPTPMPKPDAPNESAFAFFPQAIAVQPTSVEFTG